MALQDSSRIPLLSQKLPELLAPAGNPECAIAAIQNGSDAVYLGLKKGSARAGADNYTWTELEETLKYAHLRDCRVYLALNILFTDREMEETVAAALQAASLGVDALILQDVGLSRRLLELRAEGKLPAGTELHASTQMGIATPEGARFLRKFGFDRIITARELSLPELTELCKEGLPVECFIHGALCMSFSGQCLLSSYIGKRSGNRGHCAQPCRLCYRLHPSGNPPAHLLSPADFCALPLLDALVETGVASLKIEGRLKSPEYVALTSGIYRKALNHVAAGTFTGYRDGDELRADLQELELLFSRGHFTKGYLPGKISREDITYNNPGRKGLSIGTVRTRPRLLPRPADLPARLRLYELQVETNTILEAGDGITVYTPDEQVYLGGTVNKFLPSEEGGGLLTVAGNPEKVSLQENAASFPLPLFLTHSVRLFKKIHQTYAQGAENRRIPIRLTFTAQVGARARLQAEDTRGNQVAVQSPLPVSSAENHPTDTARMRDQLGKLGGTLYIAEEIRIEAEPDIFLPVSVLNSLRREALSSLSACRTSALPLPGGAASKDMAVPTRALRKEPAPGDKTCTLYFYRTADFINSDRNALQRRKPFLIYIPYKTWDSAEMLQKARQKAQACGAGLIASFPFLSLGDERKMLLKLLPEILATADGIQLINPGDFTLIPENLPDPNFLICADSSLNITNADTARFLRDQGAQILTLSPEIVRDGPVPQIPPAGAIFEQMEEGPVPLMRTRHCVLTDKKPHCGKCRHTNSAFRLTDSPGASYEILPQPEDCQNILLAPGPFPVAASRSPVQPGLLQRINLIKELT